MKKADMAMYAAKERNKSKYRYYSFSIGNKETVKLNQEMVLEKQSKTIDLSCIISRNLVQKIKK